MQIQERIETVKTYFALADDTEALAILAFAAELLRSHDRTAAFAAGNAVLIPE